MVADEIAQTVKTYSVDVSGINDGGVDWAAGQVFGAHVADGAVAFVGQAKGIKALVAGGAERVGPVLGQHLAYWEIGLRFVAGELGHYGRRRWYADAQHLLYYPVTSLYRAGAEAGGVLRHEDGHGEDAAAAVLVGVVD